MNVELTHHVTSDGPTIKVCMYGDKPSFSVEWCSGGMHYVGANLTEADCEALSMTFAKAGEFIRLQRTLAALRERDAKEAGK